MGMNTLPQAGQAYSRQIMVDEIHHSFPSGALLIMALKVLVLGYALLLVNHQIISLNSSSAPLAGPSSPQYQRVVQRKINVFHVQPGMGSHRPRRTATYQTHRHQTWHHSAKVPPAHQLWNRTPDKHDTISRLLVDDVTWSPV